MTGVLDALRGGLVVSCQAYPGEPMRDPRITAAVALSVAAGGAVGIRAQGLDDVAAVRAVLALPLIGLVKRGGGVVITPTVEDCARVARAGAHVVALDGTRRPRPDGSRVADGVAAAHAGGALAMADCGSLADAVASAEAGADLLGTTLAGHTGERPRTAGPDLELLAQLVALGGPPVLAEGRVRTPEEARRCLDLGAHAVVVGTAITHPATLARGFADALAGARPPGAVPRALP